MIFDKLEAAGFPGRYEELVVFLRSSIISERGLLLPSWQRVREFLGFFCHGLTQPGGRIDEGWEMSAAYKGPPASAVCEVSPCAASCLFQVLVKH